jgi:hypothetical protein
MPTLGSERLLWVYRDFPPKQVLVARVQFSLSDGFLESATEEGRLHIYRRACAGGFTGAPDTNRAAGLHSKEVVRRACHGPKAEFTCCRSDLW